MSSEDPTIGQSFIANAQVAAGLKLSHELALVWLFPDWNLLLAYAYV